MGEKENKEEKREDKRGIGVNKGKYPYFVFLFTIGP